jgi:ribosomal protein S16
MPVFDTYVVLMIEVKERKGGEAVQHIGWHLPRSRRDKAKIKNVVNAAETFVSKNGGTVGQMNAARKALTDLGIHIRLA